MSVKLISPQLDAGPDDLSQIPIGLSQNDASSCDGMPRNEETLRGWKCFVICFNISPIEERSGGILICHFWILLS